MSEPYNDALVDLVARALWDWSFRHSLMEPWDAGTDEAHDGARELARSVLSALADAGRLMPEAVIEYGVRVDEPHPARGEKRGAIITHLGAEKSRAAPQFWHGWTAVQRQVVHVVGPWVEVTDGQ